MGLRDKRWRGEKKPTGCALGDSLFASVGLANADERERYSDPIDRAASTTAGKAWSATVRTSKCFSSIRRGVAPDLLNIQA
jgi:hypothetical protein